MLVMTSSPSAVDSRVKVDSRLEVLLPEELLDRLEAAWLGIEQDPRAQVTELMGVRMTPPRRLAYVTMSHATVAGLLGEPSAFTNSRSGLWPTTFGAMRSRYSISIFAIWGGMSKASSTRALAIGPRARAYWSENAVSGAEPFSLAGPVAP
jgi:hypothetical protein